MAFTNIQNSQRDFLIGYLRGTGRELSQAQAGNLFNIKNLNINICKNSWD